MATKGVVGMLTAIAPLLDIIMQWGSVDSQLNKHALHMLNAVQLLVFTHTHMRIDRKVSVTKVVHSRLGKELIKEKRDRFPAGGKPSRQEQAADEVSQGFRQLHTDESGIQKEVPSTVRSPN